jgi:hypothetical protein
MHVSHPEVSKKDFMPYTCQYVGHSELLCKAMRMFSNAHLLNSRF